MLKLLKVMATMASASLLSQVLGIFTNKIFAVVMGPAGVGMYGLYRQLIDIAAGIASIGSGGGLDPGDELDRAGGPAPAIGCRHMAQLPGHPLDQPGHDFFCPGIARNISCRRTRRSGGRLSGSARRSRSSIA